MAKSKERRESLVYHAKPKPGKIEVIPTKKYNSQRDLAIAYSPGVAIPCQEIEKDPSNVYKYTNKSNLVAVISNGTAVLGQGDIGPDASKPVMEGKALLFKIFAVIWIHGAKKILFLTGSHYLGPEMIILGYLQF